MVSTHIGQPLRNRIFPATKRGFDVKMLQIKYIFYYSPNIFSTFFSFTLFFFQIRFLCKHKLTFIPTLRWNEELGKMRLSECRGQTCLNYAEHEHLRRSQLGVAMLDVRIAR